MTQTPRNHNRLHFFSVVLDPTPHAPPTPLQEKTLVAHAHRVANPKLGQHDVFAAMVVAEDVAAQPTVVPALPQRVQERGEAHRAARLRALVHHVVRNPLRCASLASEPPTRVHAVEGVEHAGEAEGAHARDVVVRQEHQPLAVVLAVAALAHVAVKGRRGSERLRAQREVALRLLLRHERYG